MKQLLFLIIFISLHHNLHSNDLIKERKKISTRLTNLTIQEKKEILTILNQLKKTKFVSRTVLNAFTLNKEYKQLSFNAKKIINDIIVKVLNKEIELFNEYLPTRNISKELTDFVQTILKNWKANRPKNISDKDYNDILSILKMVKSTLIKYFDVPQQELITEEEFEKLKNDTQEALRKINNFFLKNEIKLLKEGKTTEEINNKIIELTNFFIEQVHKSKNHV